VLGGGCNVHEYLLLLGYSCFETMRIWLYHREVTQWLFDLSEVVLWIRFGSLDELFAFLLLRFYLVRFDTLVMLSCELLEVILNHNIVRCIDRTILDAEW
jgi:hypothetical protein